MYKKRFFCFLAALSIFILPALASAEVLWDQPVSTNTNAYYSQSWPGEAAVDDSYIADDFEAETYWKISKITVPGAFWAGSNPTLEDATSLNWKIYADNAGKPDGVPTGPEEALGNDPVWQLSLDPADEQVALSAGSGGDISNTTLVLDEAFTLPPGKYWLVFYPFGALSDLGGYGRQPSSTTNGYAAQCIQPWPDRSNKNFPGTWTSVVGLDWAGWGLAALDKKDFAFTVEGDAAAIAVDPTALGFGSVAVGEEKDLTLTITNNGSTVLDITDIAISGEGFTPDVNGGGTPCGTPPITLEASEFCTMAVTFAPEQGQAYTGTLTVTSNDTVTPVAEIAMTGTGDAPDIDVSPESLAFPLDPGVPSVTKQITITNNGVAGLVISNITQTGSNFFSIAKGTCDNTTNFTLAPAASCDLDVTFEPVTLGTFSGTLTIASNDPIKPTVTVALSGSSVFEGTIGSVFTISGTGFGDKKGKVLIGGYAAKIGKGGWKSTEITCTVKKPLPAKPYNIVIKPPKKAPTITLNNAFVMKNPEITDDPPPSSGNTRDEITLNGNFFGTKKGKVYFEYEKGSKTKKKNCKVKKWEMNKVIFFVPKTTKSFPAGTYPLKVSNKVGIVTVGDFTINASNNTSK